MAETGPSQSDETAGAGDDRAGVLGKSSGNAEGGRPAKTVDLDEFRRAVRELGLMRAEELERYVTGATGGVRGLSSALVHAGKPTLYQATALAQGKGRGLVIGNYFILDKLGAGGMGVVFKARHRRLGRVVALKLLPPSLARNNNLLSRFRREVAVAARLSHPNIVAVLDANEDRGAQFMTMEYIEGNDLDRLVRDGGPLPVDQALDCVIQAALGLAEAHGQGIVHRDIKPANLMLDGAGVVRVLDLGLARLVEAANPFGVTVSGPLTKSGTYMGTVDFMAPEQGIDSRRVDHRADIYSLGCTLCYLLTGRPPFDGATVLSRLIAHQERSPSSLPAARPDVPETVDAVYQKMMAKVPADRPASMTEVIKLLEQCRSMSGNVALTRSGLKTFAESVAIKRGTLGETERDSILIYDEGPGEPVRSERIFDDGDQRRPAAPVARTLVENPASVPTRTVAIRHRPMAYPNWLVVGLGAAGLLAIGTLCYFLVPAGAGKAAADPGTVKFSEVAAAIQRAPASAQPKLPPPEGPPSPMTFDVTTLYTIVGTDNHTASVETIAVTADGRRALVGSWIDHAYVIDVDTGKRVGPPIGPQNGWQGGRPTVAMTPDGRRALIGTGKVGLENFQRAKVKRTDGILWFWDLATGEELWPKRQPYHGPIASVAISPDGRRGLSASWDGELTLWDLATGEPRSLGTQRGKSSPHDMDFFPMAVFPDGRRAATAVHDKLVHIWDLETGSEQAPLSGHGNTISGLAISPDGRRIVSGSFDGSVILWDVARGEMLHRFEMPPNDKGANVSFDTDGHIVAAGNGLGWHYPHGSGSLIVWNADTHAIVRRDERPFAQHLAVAALPGGRVLTGDRYALRLWTPRQPGADASEPPGTSDRGESPVNLLELIDAQTYKIGNWEIGNGPLVSPKFAGSRVRIPYVPPPEYRIDVEVERLGPGNGYGFGLGLVVGGRQTEITIDKEVGPSHERWTGLHGLDGVPLDRNPKAHHGQLLLPSRPARMSLTVRQSSIKLTCDGTVVVDWHGDSKRLIPYLLWHIPDRKSLFLTSGSAIRFREMTLTPLTASSH